MKIRNDANCGEAYSQPLRQADEQFMYLRWWLRQVWGCIVPLLMSVSSAYCAVPPNQTNATKAATSSAAQLIATPAAPELRERTILRRGGPDGLALNTISPPSALDLKLNTNQPDAAAVASTANDPVSALKRRLEGTAKAPNAIEQALTGSIGRLESALADPSLDPVTRTAQERMLRLQMEQRDFHKQNAQLWQNLVAVRQSNDAAKVAEAEKELAGFLSIHLSKIKRKEYPQNMTLNAIMAEYKTVPGVKIPVSSTRRTILLSSIVCVVLAPIIFFAARRFWHRSRVN